MNFTILSFLMWILNPQMTAGNEFAPLTIYHELNNKSFEPYKLSDLRVLRQDVPPEDVEYRIILCCRSPRVFKNAMADSDFTIIKILNNIEDSAITCPQQLEPFVHYLEAQSMYVIGYEIIPIYNEKKLDNFRDQTMIIIGTQVEYGTNKIDDGPKRSKHPITARKHSKGEPKTCADLHLGRQFINENRFDRLYSHDNQDKIFEKLARPLVPKVTNQKSTTKDSMAPELMLSENIDDNQQSKEFDYLVPYQLTPIDDFDAESLRRTTCSYFNTVPVWKSIVEGSLRRVEEYIRKMVDVMGDAFIWTGVRGIMQLTQNNMHLDAERRAIPIPKILYKMIVHKIGKENYAMIIIIHNELFVDKQDRICESEDICSMLGWHEENDYANSGQTYCCAPLAETLQRLDISLTGVHFLDMVSLFGQ